MRASTEASTLVKSVLAELFFTLSASREGGVIINLLTPTTHKIKLKQVG